MESLGCIGQFHLGMSTLFLGSPIRRIYLVMLGFQLLKLEVILVICLRCLYLCLILLIPQHQGIGILNLRMEH